MRWRVSRSVLHGRLRVPGDKSIAHRAVMLAGLADGTSRLHGMPRGADVLSTAECLRLLGARIVLDGETAEITAEGRLLEPLRPLDAGNSGTTMRLLSGILAGQPFSSTMTGDESLRRRPMRRVIEPLSQMGAHIDSIDGRAPLIIEGAPLRAIQYALPVASAQVKSAVLLAGLFADGETAVTETIASRDHTERLFAGLGIPVHRSNGTVTVSGGARPSPFALDIPGDFSSAAFFLTAAALRGGEIAIEGVGINPTRTGLVDIMERMGATVDIRDELLALGEPAGTITVSGSPRRPVTVNADEVPRLIDELPLVALLATQASGISTIRGAAELRHKETDRIAAVASALAALGADIRELPDGFVIRGPTPLRGASVSSSGDHRLAMMLAVAGSIAHGETVIDGVESADISYPEFARHFAGLEGALDAA